MTIGAQLSMMHQIYFEMAGLAYRSVDGSHRDGLFLGERSLWRTLSVRDLLHRLFADGQTRRKLLTLMVANCWRIWLFKRSSL